MIDVNAYDRQDRLDHRRLHVALVDAGVYGRRVPADHVCWPIPTDVIMPRFFFHVHDGVSMPDLEGQVLPDVVSARNAAVQKAGALLLQNPEQFWNDDDWSVDVRDEFDNILFTLHFVATVAPAGRLGKDKGSVYS